MLHSKPEHPTIKGIHIKSTSAKAQKYDLDLYICEIDHQDTRAIRVCGEGFVLSEEFSAFDGEIRVICYADGFIDIF